jgi:Ca-activated chloride channel homolog
MRWTWNAVMFLLLGSSIAGQESVVPKVSIPLIAIGSHRQPNSITVESLVISDQKKPVVGASLQRGSDLPLELGVLLDTSGSERVTPIDNIVKAVNQFVIATVRGPEDRTFLLSFEATSQATGWLKKDQIQDGSPLQVKIGGATALYDAIGTACRQRWGPRDWQKPTRRVLVLISDGEDNVSHITRDEAVSEALNSGAVIFAINTKTSGFYTKGEKTMEYMAELTGGESYSNLSKSDIPKVFASIEQLIDAMYFLTYRPPDGSHGAVHEVEVRLAPKQKFELSYARKYTWKP